MTDLWRLSLEHNYAAKEHKTTIIPRELVLYNIITQLDYSDLLKFEDDHKSFSKILKAQILLLIFCRICDAEFMQNSDIARHQKAQEAECLKRVTASDFSMTLNTMLIVVRMLQFISFSFTN